VAVTPEGFNFFGNWRTRTGVRGRKTPSSLCAFGCLKGAFTPDPISSICPFDPTVSQKLRAKGRNFGNFLEQPVFTLYKIFDKKNFSKM
jgi:hypothetical protein